LLGLGCAKPSGDFRSGDQIRQPLPEAEHAEVQSDPGYGYQYQYAIKISNYDTILPLHKTLTLIPTVQRVIHEGLQDNSKLSTEELQDWQIRYRIDGKPLFPEPQQGIQKVELQLDTFRGHNGYKILETEFTNEKYAKKYVLSKRVYLDEHAPKVFFSVTRQISSPLELQWPAHKDKYLNGEETITGMMIGWSVNDDISVDESSFAVFSCRNDVISPTIKPQQFLDRGCRQEYNATQLQQLTQKHGQQSLEVVYPLDQAAQEMDSRTFLFYAHDKVGNETYQFLGNSKQDKKRLSATLLPVVATDSPHILSVDPQDKRLFYSKSRELFLRPVLKTHGTHGDEKEVPLTQAAEQDWQLYLSRDGVSYQQLAFASNSVQETGLFRLAAQCQEESCPTIETFTSYVSAENLQSPSELLRIKYDDTPPQVSDLQIQVEGNLLLKGRRVHLQWKVDDPEGSPLRGYQVSIRRLSDVEKRAEDEKKQSLLPESEYFVETYRVLFPANSTIRTDSISSYFVWGEHGNYNAQGKRNNSGKDWSGNNSKAELFDVFVSVIDAAGNVSKVTSARYYPQIFNAALVTQDVKCLFCHMHVYGDIVGIDFPSAPHGNPGLIHGHAGRGLMVEGKMIANNQVPLLEVDDYYETPWEYAKKYMASRTDSGEPFESLRDSVKNYLNQAEPSQNDKNQIEQAYRTYQTSLPAEELKIRQWQAGLFRTRAVFGTVSNYDEEKEALRVFPRDKDGKIGMPDIDVDSLREKMQGTLRVTLHDRNGQVLRPFFIDRTFTGNMYLAGTREKPIQIRGEVFIEGNIILKGYFEGRGTIYAHNIFIVDDLVAMDSPFPFPKPDYRNGSFEPARQRAIEILQKEPHMDSLYLGAILTQEDRNKDSVDRRSGQITIGGPGRYDWGRVYPFQRNFPKKKSSDEVYADLRQEENRYVGGEEGYLGLGVLREYREFLQLNQQLSPFQEIRSGSMRTYPRTAWWSKHGRKEIDVARVDSYLYAATGLSWQSYANFLLNGGFMSPEVKLTSGLVHRFVGHVSRYIQDWEHQAYDVPSYQDPEAWKEDGSYNYPWRIINSNTEGFDVATRQKNPKNSMPMWSNWIRYDFRLQVGGPGFESLRAYFNYSNRHLQDNQAIQLSIPETCDPFLDSSCKP
ncbi:MAG: hypothetical protein OXT67_04220, partial [Zetaproteobacteria bacterium]|nr:hypothetical protein [Zetaproteobacteria bacterium]